MDIITGAEIIVNDWLNAKKDEVLHFITDENHLREAEAFEAAAMSRGAVTKITVVDSSKVQNGEIIQDIKNTMCNSDAIIGATDYSFITTSAVEYCLKKGSRFLSIPMHTNDGSSLFENEFIGMDTIRAKNNAKKIIEKLRNADTISVKTSLGTDVTFSKVNRSAGYFNGVCSKKSSKSSASFEVFVPIVENSANGKIIVDGSLGYLGIVDKPFEILFKDGYISSIENNTDGKRLRDYIDSFKEKEMFCASEFGIGINEKASCRGICYIEDESSSGTFHVGFGRNLALGGVHNANGHFDIIINKPTIWADKEMILFDGHICG